MNKQNIPDEIKKIALSVEIYDKAEKIGEAFGLHIDQIGELDKEIRQIFLGITDSSMFVKNISKSLEIDEKMSVQIANEVNREIFDTIKSKLQFESNYSDVSTLERIGGFEVDKPAVEAESNDVTSADKASILAGVENPVPTVPTMTPQKSSVAPHSAPAPTNLPTGTPAWSEGNKPAPSPAKIIKNEQHTEPIVDFLLGNAAAAPAQKVVSAPPPSKPTTPTAQPSPASPKKSGPDPYREQI